MDATLAEVMADQVRMNHHLLLALAQAAGNNEKVQRRFRNVVLVRLAKIETVVTEVLGAQLMEFWPPYKGKEEEREQFVKDLKTRIDQLSELLGMKMTQYIYTEPPPEEPRHDYRRKWTGWEI